MKIDFSSAEVCTKFSLVINFFLGIVKLLTGWIGHSQALIADALNSFMDLVTNAVVWMGLVIAKKPADREHPYGHGNADTLAAAFVAVILLLTGAYIGFQALRVIFEKKFVTPSYLTTVVAVLVIIIKEFLFRYTLKVGRRANSPAVIANAWDHRSDVYATSGALVGIVVAQLGVPVLDPLAGVWIGFLIVRQAIRVFKENIHSLMVGSPPPSVVKEVQNILSRVPEVRGISATKMRSVGASQIVDIDILVDREITVEQGHIIAEKVKATILQENRYIQDVMVHVEPLL